MSNNALNLSTETDFDVQKLTKVFTDIGERSMRDMPIYNKSLSTYAEGFTVFNGYFIGVLVSPWFLNIMAFPARDKIKQKLFKLSVGAKSELTMPAGTFEFVKGSNDILGDYLSCSLLSPVFELQNQKQAIDTVHLSLQEIMTEPKSVDSERKPELVTNEICEVKTVSRRDFITGFRSTTKTESYIPPVAKGSKL